MNFIRAFTNNVTKSTVNQCVHYFYVVQYSFFQVEINSFVDICCELIIDIVF